MDLNQGHPLHVCYCDPAFSSHTCANLALMAGVIGYIRPSPPPTPTLPSTA